jgi:hypothetical protein
LNSKFDLLAQIEAKLGAVIEEPQLAEALQLVEAPQLAKARMNRAPRSIRERQRSESARFQRRVGKP